MSDLSILCVTKGEQCVWPLLARLVKDADSLGAECVLAIDNGGKTLESLEICIADWADAAVIVYTQSSGYIESVLDKLIPFTLRRYVLRIDDDESISPAMLEWLRGGAYETALHWKFPRAHLWPTPDSYIINPPLWPDHQTRLSVREQAGGRTTIHAGSPFGGGALAPCALYHHKFLVKTREQRQQIADRYERLQPGAGRDFMAFSVPESVFQEVDVRTVAEADERATADAAVMSVVFA